jgi:hypothetical protein
VHEDSGAFFFADAHFQGSFVDQLRHSFKELLEQVEDKWICISQAVLDNFVIFMSLANGRSSVQCGPLEPHTKSSIFTTAKLTGATFTCYKNTDGHLKAHDLLENGFGTEEKGSKFLIVCNGVAKKC